MQTRDIAVAAAEIIDSTHKAIGGVLPIAAHQLAVCCGFTLAPIVGGYCASDMHVSVEGVELVRWLHYDASLPPAVQARCIALVCARWLVERANKSPDAPLVEAVASGLCGGCKPLVRATAALLAAVAQQGA